MCDMALFIYPIRMKEYIPVLSRIYQYCVYWEMDWKKVIIDFCKSSDSDIPEKDVYQIEGFINYLSESGQEPQQWDIDYEIGDISDEEKASRNLKRTIRNYHYWKHFEKYIENENK